MSADPVTDPAARAIWIAAALTGKQAPNQVSGHSAGQTPSVSAPALTGMEEPNRISGNSDALPAQASGLLAASLIGTDESNRFSGNSGALPEPTTGLPANVSFNADVPHRGSHVGSGSKATLVGGLVCVLLAAALTVITAIGQVTVADIWQRFPINRTSQVASFSPSPKPDASAEPSGPAISRVLIQIVRATPGEPALLGLAVQGRPEGAVVHIKGLLPGMELSTGNPVGPDAWEIPITDLDYASIAPPQGFAGSADLVVELRLPDNRIADRQGVKLTWESLISPEPRPLQFNPEQIVQEPQKATAGRGHADREEAVSSISRETTLPSEGTESRPSISWEATVQSQSRETGLSISPEATIQSAAKEARLSISEEATLQSEAKEAGPSTSPEAIIQSEAKEAGSAISATPAPREVNREHVSMLLKRGKDLIASGDLAAARLVLQRAAEANDMDAALALAATYDPYVLRELKVYSLAADPELARTWYEKARQLGSTAAPRRLERLDSAAR